MGTMLKISKKGIQILKASIFPLIWSPVQFSFLQYIVVEYLVFLENVNMRYIIYVMYLVKQYVRDVDICKKKEGENRNRESDRKWK